MTQNVNEYDSLTSWHKITLDMPLISIGEISTLNNPLGVDMPLPSESYAWTNHENYK